MNIETPSKEEVKVKAKEIRDGLLNLCFKETEDNKSIADTVMAAVSSFKADVETVILLCGGASKIPNLKQRLDEALKA